MSNINVRVVGTANMAGMTGPFAKLEAQVTALNAQLAEMVTLSKGVDASGYQRMSSAAAANSKNFRNAAASTGMFEVQQLRLNKATDDYVSKLQKQKLSFGQMLKQQAVGQQAFRQQLQLEQMIARTNRTGISHGKTIVDTLVPNTVALGSRLEYAGKQLSFWNQQIRSGATQMVNWGKNTQWAGRQLMVGFTMPIAAIGAAAGVMAYQVDQAFTRVAKVYNTTAQGGIEQDRELARVREEGMKTAMTAAQQYGEAGTDTLNVQAELAAAGQKGLELQKDTLAVMRIVRLGELDYNDAIKTTIALQSVFNMNAQKLGETFNYINAVENQTSLQTKDFAAAIPIAAAPVKAFGGNIQELGTLLVAMRQNGIEATQGANAIKAAMQRLGRPSEQVQKEWTALTNTDITKIFDKSDSLIDLFTQIGDATKNLDPKDQIRAFAGLFGTYQVTRMMAMVHGMEDLKNNVGQVSTAAKLAGQSTSDWAKISQQEIERYKDSISGKWDRAIEDMKLQLSTLGEPFVEVATGIISKISDLIKWFNKLPDSAKHLIALGIGIGALSGVVIMLVGLMANWLGTMMKVGTAIAGFFLPKLELMTTEQKAASLVAEAYGVELTKEMTAIDQVTASLGKMTEAQAYANRMTRRGTMTGLMAGGLTARQAAQASQASVPLVSVSGQTVGSVAKVEKSTSKMRGYLQSSAVSAGLMGAAMITMATSSNSTVDHMAEMVLYASMLGPMLIPVVKGIGAAGMAAMTAMRGATGPMAALRAGAAAFAGSIGVAALAITGIVVGLGAAAYIYYKWHKHQQDVIREEVKAQDSITNAAKSWADQMGVVEKHYAKVNVLSSNIQGAGMQSGQFQKNLDYYNTNTAGNETRKAFKSLSPDAQTNAALKIYSDLIVKMGLNAKQAQSNISALFVASGQDFFTAQQRAAYLADALGNVSGRILDWRDTVRVGGLYLNDIAQNADHSSARMQELEAATKDFAETFSAAFNQSKTPQQAQHVMDELQKTVMTGWKRILEQVRQNPLGEEFLATNNIRNANQLRNFVSVHGNTLAGPMHELVNQQTTFEASLARSLGLSMGLGDQFQNLADLSNNWYIQSKQMSYSQVVDQAKQLAATMGTGPLGDLLGVSGKPMAVSTNKGIVAQFKAAAKAMPTAQLQALATQMNQIAAGQGIQQAQAPWKTLANILGGVKVGMDDTGDSAKRASDDVKGVKSSLDMLPTRVSVDISMKQAGTIIHDAMAATQEDMATSAMDSFNASWDSRMNAQQSAFESQSNALQRRQESASNALQRRQQNAQDAMDRRFQAREDAITKSYDHRIAMVQKEIKAEQDADAQRQKMFEAEKARLAKLAEMANQNIDFNTAINEGRFDDAAKIKNDVGAADATAELDREEANAAARMQKRIDRLEKRNDRLGKARDRELKQLQKIEDAQKKHLERMQQRQTAALQRAQEQQTAALKKRQDAEEAAMQKTRDYDEAMLQQRLDLFKSYVARNKKDLERWMKEVGLSYDDFGTDVKAKGEAWSKYFQTALTQHIRQAGMQVLNDNIWQKIGESMAGKLLRGIGFKSKSAFEQFVKTGNLPKTFAPGEQRHTGGEIGSGGGSRGSIPNHYRGNHPSEVMVRAQRGEYMVSKQAYSKHKNLIQAINEGTDMGGIGGHVMDEPGFNAALGGFGPIAGFETGALWAVFREGVKAAMEKGMGKTRKKARAASRYHSKNVAGGFKPGPGGRHRPVAGPVTNGLHDQWTGYPAVDMAGPVGRPVYAVGNGTITRSYDIPGPLASDSYNGDGPYGSYGRVIYMSTDAGPEVLYAHLSKRSVSSGTRVKGGSVIGYSGNTGNSSGPHLHFGATTPGPYAWLRKGGTMKWDNTPVIGHKGETMLTEPLTRKFKENVASGGGNTYSVTVNVPERTDLDANEVANIAIARLKRLESRKPGRGRRG